MTNKKLILKIDDLGTITPLSQLQGQFFDAWGIHPIQMLYGYAGTGKTLLALYKALEDVLDKGNEYRQVIILRSATPSRDIGALPGNLEEKGSPYEDPYISLCSLLFERGDAYDRLKEQGKIIFSLTSYIKGITFDDSIIIVDEVQNLNYQELYSVITRVGENSKIVFCGDFKQRDIKDSGLQKFRDVLSLMPCVSFYNFNDTKDIVRSEVVKQFIIAEEQLLC